jgi:hypothetical protein
MPTLAKPSGRRHVGVLCLLPPLLALSILLYLWLLPRYQQLVLSESAVVLRSVRARIPLWKDSSGRWGIRHEDFTRVALGGPNHSMGLFLALAIVPPLLGALPGLFSIRVKFVAMGILSIHSFHVVAVILYIVLMDSLCHGGSPSLLCRNMKGGLVYANHAVALLTWWLVAGRQFVRETGVEAQPRESIDVTGC